MLNRSSVIFAVAAAILATSGGAAFAKEKPAEAPKPPTVSKPLVKPLSASQAASKAEKWAECLASAREAEALPNKTAYDTYVVNEMIGFCALRGGDNSAAAQAFSTAARLGIYRRRSQVELAADADAAQLHGQELFEDHRVRQSCHHVTAPRTTRSACSPRSPIIFSPITRARSLFSRAGWLNPRSQAATPSDNALGLYLSSCIKLEDDACMMRALVKQAAYQPKPDTWTNLVVMMLRSATDDGTLQVYRLASEVGAMRRGEDYLEMAQLANEKGLPGEAQAALEAAIAKKSFADPKSSETATRLLATVKTQATADKATLPKQALAAAPGKNGQVDVRLGQAFLSYGQYPEALAAIQRGIGKGNVKNVAEAQLALGQAYLKLGNKAEATKVFNAVQGDELMTRLGNLWAAHAQR